MMLSRIGAILSVLLHLSLTARASTQVCNGQTVNTANDLFNCGGCGQVVSMQVTFGAQASGYSLSLYPLGGTVYVDVDTTCNGCPNQIFTYNGSLIMSGGLCLTQIPSSPPVQVVLGNCSNGNPNQYWYYDPTTSFIHGTGGGCLIMSTNHPNPGSFVEVYATCGNTPQQELWTMQLVAANQDCCNSMPTYIHTNMTCCNGTSYTSVVSDPANCGSCGHQVPIGYLCSGGVPREIGYTTRPCNSTEYAAYCSASAIPCVRVCQPLNATLNQTTPICDQYVDYSCFNTTFAFAATSSQMAATCGPYYGNTNPIIGTCLSYTNGGGYQNCTFDPSRCVCTLSAVHSFQRPGEPPCQYNYGVVQCSGLGDAQYFCGSRAVNCTKRCYLPATCVNGTCSQSGVSDYGNIITPAFASGVVLDYAMVQKLTQFCINLYGSTAAYSVASGTCITGNFNSQCPCSFDNSMTNANLRCSRSYPGSPFGSVYSGPQCQSLSAPTNGTSYFEIASCLCMAPTTLNSSAGAYLDNLCPGEYVLDIGANPVACVEDLHCFQADNCSCQTGYEQPLNPTYCGFEAEAEVCLPPPPPATPPPREIVDCGEFVSSAFYLCPFNNTYTSGQCKSVCTCDPGYGTTPLPGNTVPCDGAEEACNEADIISQCGPHGYTSCVKRCQYPASSPSTRGECSVVPGTCVQGQTLYHLPCTTQQLAYCGPATLSCAQPYIGPNTAGSPQCTCTSTGFRSAYYPCDEWMQFTTTSTSVCTSSCGVGWLATYQPGGCVYERFMLDQCGLTASQVGARLIALGFAVFSYSTLSWSFVLSTIQSYAQSNTLGCAYNILRCDCDGSILAGSVGSLSSSPPWTGGNWAAQLSEEPVFDFSSLAGFSSNTAVDVFWNAGNIATFTHFIGFVGSPVPDPYRTVTSCAGPTLMATPGVNNGLSSATQNLQSFPFYLTSNVPIEPTSGMFCSGLGRPSINGGNMKTTPANVLQTFSISAVTSAYSQGLSLYLQLISGLDDSGSWCGSASLCGTQAIMAAHLAAVFTDQGVLNTAAQRISYMQSLSTVIMNDVNSYVTTLTTWSMQLSAQLYGDVFDPSKWFIRTGASVTSCSSGTAISSWTFTVGSKTFSFGSIPSLNYYATSSSVGSVLYEVLTERHAGGPCTGSIGASNDDPQATVSSQWYLQPVDAPLSSQTPGNAASGVNWNTYHYDEGTTLHAEISVSLAGFSPWSLAIIPAIQYTGCTCATFTGNGNTGSPSSPCTVNSCCYMTVSSGLGLPQCVPGYQFGTTVINFNLHDSSVSPCSWLLRFAMQFYTDRGTNSYSYWPQPLLPNVCGTIDDTCPPINMQQNCDAGQTCPLATVMAVGQIYCHQGTFVTAEAQSGYSAAAPGTPIIFCNCYPGWSKDPNTGRCITPDNNCTIPCGGVGTQVAGQCLCPPCTSTSCYNPSSCCSEYSCDTAMCASVQTHFAYCDLNTTNPNWVCSSTPQGTWSGPCCSTFIFTATGTSQCFNGGIAVVGDVITNIYGNTTTVTNEPYCLCDPNLPYTGTLCDQPTCPSTANGMCNGEGTCVSGSCQQDLCTLTGTCAAGSSGIDVCAVNGTYTPFTGCSCEANITASCIAPGTTGVCNFKGQCLPDDEARIHYTCQDCTGGYYGTYCEMAPCGSLNCNLGSGGGRCILSPDGGITPNQCQCFTAATSTRLFTGGNCTIDVTAQCGTTLLGQLLLCGGQGNCVFNQSLSAYACQCTNGYTNGPNGQCSVSPCTDNCGHGYCDTATVPPHCACYAQWSSSGGGTNKCTVQDCGPLAFPSADSLTAVCVCNDTSKSFATGCLQAGCNISTVDGTTCGKLHPLFNSNDCPSFTACPSSGASPCNCCNNGVCTCQWSAVRNPNTGLCDSICDLVHTTSISSTLVSIGNGAFATQFAGCVCASGYSAPDNCKLSICLNGGVYTAQTGTCACTLGFSGPRCQQDACFGKGVFNGTSGICGCFFPFAGAACQSSRCLNGGVATVNGPTSPNQICVCSQAYSGMLCEIDRCAVHGAGHAATNGVDCVCTGILTGQFCDTCAAPNVLSNGTCYCDPDYTGNLCQYRTCGPQGYVNRTNSQLPCVCGGVSKADGHGNCTANACGPFGAPNSDYSACLCQSGSTLLGSLDASHSVYCYPNCLNGGVYNDSSHGCTCAPGHPQNVNAYCAIIAMSSSSTARASSSTGASNSHPSSSSTAAGGNTTELNPNSPGTSTASLLSTADIVGIALGSASAVLLSVGGYFLWTRVISPRPGAPKPIPQSDPIDSPSTTATTPHSSQSQISRHNNAEDENSELKSPERSQSGSPSRVIELSPLIPLES